MTEERLFAHCAAPPCRIIDHRRCGFQREFSSGPTQPGTNVRDPLQAFGRRIRAKLSRPPFNSADLEGRVCDLRNRQISQRAMARAMNLVDMFDSRTCPIRIKIACRAAFMTENLDAGDVLRSDCHARAHRRYKPSQLICGPQEAYGTCHANPSPLAI